MSKAPYISEAALFFDAMSYARVTQTTDHRFTLEVPIRRDFIPGHTWKRCYPDGTWTLVTELCHKFRPKNVYVEDFVAKANQSTVISTPNDFRRFNVQMEGTEPVTLSEVTGPEMERIHQPDHEVQPVPKKRGGYVGRQWRDIDAPPPIPSWQRDHIRVPVPQKIIPSRALESTPFRYQVQSQAGAYREAKATTTPDLTARPTSLGEHQAQQEYVRKRGECNKDNTSGQMYPLPPPLMGPSSSSFSPAVVTASGQTPMYTGQTVTMPATQHTPAKEHLGPRSPKSPRHSTTTPGPSTGVDLSLDLPLNASRPYNMNHELTAAQVATLSDGQIKRQHAALKRKHVRALSERRTNLVQLIKRQIDWYVAEMQRRRANRLQLRPSHPESAAGSPASSGSCSHAPDPPAATKPSTTVVPTNDVTMQDATVITITDDSSLAPAVTTTATALPTSVPTEVVSYSVSSVSLLPSLFDIPPPLPKRRRLANTPPTVPNRKETSAEKLYRLFLAEPELDTANSEYWNTEKPYMWGGLSDWSDLDSIDTPARYKRRHIKNKSKHPIISRRAYRDKKLLALERGYSGTISNSPYRRATFCLNGRPAPPKWWKPEKVDKIMSEYASSFIATSH